MKTKLAIALVLGAAVVVWAADMTITIPTADVPRVQEAFGSILNLGRPANIAEVQRATTEWIHNSTLDYERRKNIATFSPPPMQMQPTPTPTPAARQTPPQASPFAKANATPLPTVTPTTTPIPTKKR